MRNPHAQVPRGEQKSCCMPVWLIIVLAVALVAAVVIIICVSCSKSTEQKLKDAEAQEESLSQQLAQVSSSGDTQKEDELQKQLSDARLRVAELSKKLAPKRSGPAKGPAIQAVPSRPLFKPSQTGGNSNCGSSCQNCYNCRNGVNLTDCASSSNCTKCQSLQSCSNCTGCKNCARCRNCTKCTNCIDDCSNCNHCKDSTSCKNCTKCTNCAGCRNCTDCSSCTNCVSCSWLTTSSDCHNVGQYTRSCPSCGLTNTYSTGGKYACDKCGKSTRKPTPKTDFVGLNGVQLPPRPFSKKKGKWCCSCRAHSRGSSAATAACPSCGAAGGGEHGGDCPYQ